MSLIASISAEWKTKIKNENNIIELGKTLLFKLKMSKQKNNLLYYLTIMNIPLKSASDYRKNYKIGLLYSNSRNCLRYRLCIAVGSN